MLSGFPRREELKSPAFCQPQTNLKTFSTAEVAGRPYPAPSTLGALQNMVESFGPLLNAQGFAPAHSMDKSAKQSHGQQRILPQGQLSTSPSHAVNASTSNDSRQSFQRPFNLLSGSNDSSLSRLTNGTIQSSANASVSSSSTSARPSGSKHLSDDEILKLIEKKLENCKAQMKIQSKDSTGVDSLNSRSTCSCQGSRCNTPTSSESEKAPVNNIFEVKEPSENSWQGPERPQMKSTPVAKHFTEYVRKIQETAAVGMKEDNPGVLGALSGPSLEELLTQNPSLTVHRKPSNQDNQSSWRNGKPGLDTGRVNDLPITPKNTQKEVDIVPGVADSSILRESPSKPPKTSDQQNHQTPCSIGVSECHLIQNVRTSANYQVTEAEPEQNLMQKMQDKEVQAGESSFKSEGSSMLKDSKYEDVTDDEEFNEMPLLSPHYDQISESVQPLEQTANLNSWTNAPSALAVMPLQQGLEMPLTCTCPYFVETDEGFEKMPKCPKCPKDAIAINPEVQSEDESDEVILFVMDLKLKDEIIVVDSEDDNEVEQNMSSPEPHNQHSRFPKVDEYDTFDSFCQKVLPNHLAAIAQAPEPSPAPQSLCTPVEKVSSEQVLPHSNLQKQLDTVENVSKPAPDHRSLGIFEKFSTELGPSSRSDAEDSCDTEDSLDYPSLSKSNYLTASYQVRAPSPHTCDFDITEGEVVESPEKNTDDWFPRLSSDTTKDEDESAQNSINNATVLPIAARPVEMAELDEPKTKKRKAKSKSRRISSSDSESDNDKEGSKTLRSGFSSENGEASTQVRKRSLKSRYHRPAARPETSDQNASPVLQKRQRSCPILSDSDSDDESDQNRSKIGRMSPSETGEASTQPLKSCLKPGIQNSLERQKSLKPFESGENQEGSKTHRRNSSIESDVSTQSLKPALNIMFRLPALSPEPQGQDVQSITSSALDNVQSVKNPAKKRKSQTDHTSEKPVKRRKSSLAVQTPGVVVNALSVHEKKARKSDLIQSKAKKTSGRSGSRRPSLSNKSDRKPPEVEDAQETIPDTESSVPPQNQSQPTPSTSRNVSQPTPSTSRNVSQPTPSTSRNVSQPTPSTSRNVSQPTPSTSRNQSQPTPSTSRSQSQPTPHYSSFVNPNQVKSTSARKRLNEDWEKQHVSIRKERRSSIETAHAAPYKLAARRDQDVRKPKRRRRHNSQGLLTTLMKNSKLEAQQWTKAIHRAEPPAQNIAQPLGEGYKWKGDKPVEDNDEDWLDKMYGGVFQRPHF